MSDGLPTKTVGDLCAFVGSGVTPRGGSAVYVDSGILFIRSQNVYSDGLRLDDVAHIPEWIHEEMRRSALRPYDVLYNITGASIGRCTYYPNGLGPANVNQHVCLLRIHDAEERDAVYLARVLDSEIGRRQLRALNAGSNREGLNYRQLKSFAVPWPTAATRHRIAEILDTIDQMIQATERVVAKLRAIESGLRRDLLNGAVDGLRRDEWRRCRIGDFASVQRGASPRPIDNPEWFSDDGPGWIRISDVTAAGDVLLATRDKLSEAGAARSRRVSPGDVIMSIAATIGVAIVVGIEACYHDGFVRLEHDGSVIPEFLVMLLEHHKGDFLRSGQTGTQANINSTIVANVEVAIPNLETQATIVAAAASARHAIRQEEQYVRSLRQTRTGLASDILSGRVRTGAA